MPEREYDREAVEKLRTCLGEELFSIAWDEGRLLSPNDAAELALESIDAAASDAPA